MTDSIDPSRAIAHACALVVRFGAAGAIAVTKARLTAGLDAFCDVRFLTMYGTGPRDRRPVGLTS